MGGAFSLKRYVNCVLPQRKNTLPLWIDTFVPSSYNHRLVRSSFEFQEKVDTVWNNQVKSYKPHSLSRTIVDIYSDNVREPRQCVMLHLHLVKLLESTAVNLISIFASSTKCLCLKTNQSDLSFTVHKF